jgi:hypothetical protein
VQSILAYATDDVICEKTNELVNKGKIKIEIPHLFEMKDQYARFAVTRYGLIYREEGDSVENLRDLLLGKLTEKQLAPELRNYIGDYRSKVLEYCIKHDPLEILVNLFGLPILREIASQWKLNIGFSRVNPREVATLILLKLGFNVPPELEGMEAYARRLKHYESEFMTSSDVEARTASMTRVYVEIERLLKDLANFYVGFLWQNEISEFSERENITELLKRKVLKPTKKLKPVDKLTMGDFIHVLRYLNGIAGKNRRLSSRMKKVLERTAMLPKRLMAILDEISPFRSCFTHPKTYPGSDVCRKILDLATEFGEILSHDCIYPTALRITREINDDYGRRYAEGVDENDHRWTIYTRRLLMPEKHYMMYSRTNPIAINPVLVQKI